MTDIAVGIDTLAFYTSPYYLDLTMLAQARQVSPGRYLNGLGQQAVSIAAPGTDVVTLAANAAKKAMQGIDLASIDMLLFATETGIDQSKAAGIYVHKLLGLPPCCRIVELKQACYSATAALQMAVLYVQAHPDRRVVVVASDIARYALASPGEPTQGCGAVAMTIAADPKIVALEPGSGFLTEDVTDFWRPNYSEFAFVDGKQSVQVYLRALKQCWQYYQQKSQRMLSDHHFFCYHAPYPRLVEKAHHQLLTSQGYDGSQQLSKQQVADSLIYARANGNAYTASLCICLLSLLDNNASDLSGQRISMYSYGSGAVAELFSVIVCSGYQKHLRSKEHQAMLASRRALTMEEYQTFHQQTLPTDGSEFLLATDYDCGDYRFLGLREHQRLYTPRQQVT